VRIYHRGAVGLLGCVSVPRVVVADGLNDLTADQDRASTIDCSRDRA